MHVPDHVRQLKEKALAAGGGKRLDDVEFTFVKGKWRCLGEATLMNRVKSHTDVSEIWVSRFRQFPSCCRCSNAGPPTVG